MGAVSDFSVSICYNFSFFSFIKICSEVRFSLVELIFFFFFNSFRKFFIYENLLFYSGMLLEFASRACRFNLHSVKDAYLLFRVIKVCLCFTFIFKLPVNINKKDLVH